MDTTEILTVILLVSASALCIALIIIHIMIAKSVHTISSNFTKLSIKVNSFIDSAQELSQKVDNIANEINSQLKISRSVVSDVREFADKLLNVETKIRDGIVGAVVPFTRNFRALGKGVGSFWQNYKR